MTDYDSPWKTLLQRFFPAFLEFFFPAAHAGIDWSQGYAFLDKELQKVVRDAKLGRRWADSLVRVTGLDGTEDWVLVHIEVQGTNKPDFAQRMFVYNYRIYDRYARPVVSLAVLGEPWAKSHGCFGYVRWGCQMRLRFPMVSLTAYREQWATLEASTNPFAVVTQAHLKAQETAGSDATRYQEKLILARSLYRRGYNRQDILELFQFIDWVLTLPEELESQLWTEVQQFDEEKHMQYVSSFERIFTRRGLEKGMEKGMEKGLLRGQALLLQRLLTRRFGALPEWVDARLNQALPAQLETWGDRVLDAQSLEEVFAPANDH